MQSAPEGCSVCTATLVFLIVANNGRIDKETEALKVDLDVGEFRNPVLDVPLTFVMVVFAVLVKFVHVEVDGSLNSLLFELSEGAIFLLSV